MKNNILFAFLVCILPLTAAFVGCQSFDTGDTVADIRNELLERAKERKEAQAGEADERRDRTRRGTEELPVILGKLTLSDAVTLAMANNRTLKTAYLTRMDADGAIMEAYAGALPNANLSLDAHNTWIDGDSDDTYSLGVEVVQPLWRSGALD